MSQVNGDRVRLLVDALRSGEFEQGRGRLNRDDELCCLGVACVVAQRAGLALRAYTDEDGDVHYGRDDDGWKDEEDYAQLPRSVQEWYGFEFNDPELRAAVDGEHEDTYQASTLNDDYAYDFAQIADAFERTFLLGEENAVTR